MKVVTLYRFNRKNGGITESPKKPDTAGYATRCRLIADKGKILTDGETKACCIDVDSADGWTEIDATIEGSEYE